MTVRNITRAQRARLKRTLFAVAAAAAMSLVIGLLYIRGATWLAAPHWWTLMAAFWLVNLGFVLMILSNLNLRLSEPSMTLAQMMWATISTFILAFFISEGRHLLLMIYLLAMMFGSFRLNMAQHLLVAATALVSYAIIIASGELLHPDVADLPTELLNWVVFLVVLTGFSALSGETSRLRAALVRGNRELREAHEAKEIAFEAKSRFLASTSHELRTPLNAMLGATDIVDRAALEPDQRDALNRARYAGKHLLSLVNSMIDLSRIESGALELRAQPMNLHEEIGSLHAVMSPDALLRGVEFTSETDSLSTASVMGDAMRIQQVLLHLLKLAISSAHVRKVHFHARTVSHGEAVHFSITSTTDQKSKTDRDAENIDDPVHDNFSLGLCQKLIAVMEGTLVTSRISDNQIRFDFELDLPAAPPPTIDLPASNKRRKILIVDDSIDNRMLLQAYLKDQPWELRFAEDGLMAVAQARQESFDLILMDIHMPRMNGIDATRIIRRIEGEQPARLPAKILAVTADDSIDAHQNSIRAGCDEHLIKPVSKKSLLQILAGMTKVYVSESAAPP